MKKEDVQPHHIYWMHYNLFSNLDSTSLVECLESGGRKPRLKVIARVGGLAPSGSDLKKTGYRFLFALNDPKFIKHRHLAIKEIIS
jgi:hypothetical protein